MNHSFRTYTLWGLVFVLALLSLSVPKLILCLYYQGSLWQHYRMSDLFQASAQDLLLATIWTGCLGWLMTSSKRLKTKMVLATTG